MGSVSGVANGYYTNNEYENFSIYVGSPFRLLFSKYIDDHKHSDDDRTSWNFKCNCIIQSFVHDMDDLDLHIIWRYLHLFPYGDYKSISK